MSEKVEKQPLYFNLTKWYGYIFATVFILYGGVEIILGVMDHNYQNFASYFIFLLMGLILLTVVLAYRDLKVWGWYSMIVLNIVIVILSLFQIKKFESIVLLILSLLAVLALLSPVTRDYILKKR